MLGWLDSKRDSIFLRFKHIKVRAIAALVSISISRLRSEEKYNAVRTLQRSEDVTRWLAINIRFLRRD